MSPKDAMLLMCIGAITGGTLVWFILSAVWNHGAAW